MVYIYFLFLSSKGAGCSDLVTLAVIETCEGGDGVRGLVTAGTDALGELGFAPGLDLWMLINGLLDLEETGGGLGRDQTLGLRKSLDQAEQSTGAEIRQRDLFRGKWSGQFFFLMLLKWEIFGGEVYLPDHQHSVRLGHWRPSALHGS